jgi:hypothetical protein
LFHCPLLLKPQDRKHLCLLHLIHHHHQEFRKYMEKIQNYCRHYYLVMEMLKGYFQNHQIVLAQQGQCNSALIPRQSRRLPLVRLVLLVRR